MLQLVLMAAISGIVVWFIDWRSNQSYDRIVNIHMLGVKVNAEYIRNGIATMDYEDIVDILVAAKQIIVLSNDCYFNSFGLQKAYGDHMINKLDIVKILTYLMGGFSDVTA